MVEKERRNLEKELREMQEGECFFYDLDEPIAAYEFDRRHKDVIKAQGVFRQGLQWTREEIEQYETDRIEEEKIRLDVQGKLHHR